jgi:hypothetical protein
MEQLTHASKWWATKANVACIAGYGAARPKMGNLSAASPLSVC